MTQQGEQAAGGKRRQRSSLNSGFLSAAATAITFGREFFPTMLFLLRRAARRRKNADSATNTPNNTTSSLMTDSFVSHASDLATIAGICIGLAAWWFAREDASRSSAELERYKTESQERTAKLENDTAQARLELARIDPLNLPIKSITAELYFNVLGDFESWPFEFQTMAKGVTALSLVDNEKELVTLRCVTFESVPVILSGGTVPNGRTFSLSMSWPSPDLFSTKNNPECWVETTNASMLDLTKALKAAVISHPPTKEESVILHSSCILIFNGTIRKRFTVSNKSTKGKIVCAPEQ